MILYQANVNSTQRMNIVRLPTSPMLRCSNMLSVFLSPTRAEHVITFIQASDKTFPLDGQKWTGETVLSFALHRCEMDFILKAREDGGAYFLTPLTLRAVDWLRANFAGYATQRTAGGFVAPSAVIFDTAIDKVLRSIRGCGLGVQGDAENLIH